MLMIISDFASLFSLNCCSFLDDCLYLFPSFVDLVPLGLNGNGEDLVGKVTTG